MSLFRITRIICLAGAMTCVNLVAGASSDAAKSFRISAVQEDQVWIEGGLLDGLEQGAEGEVGYEISVAGQRKRIIPAKVRLSKVEDRESTGTLYEQSGTINVGYSAQFIPKPSSELLLFFNKRASDSYTAKDYRLAREYYQRILTILPGDPFASQKIKDCDAELEKQEALKREQRNLPYYREVVRTSLKSDSPENRKLAQTYIEKILAINPGDVDALKGKEILSELASRPASAAPAKKSVTVPPPVSAPVEAAGHPSIPGGAAKETGARATTPVTSHGDAGDSRNPSSILKNMVQIPEGDYFVGSLPGRSPFENELPRHRVHLLAFYIDKNEVTNEEYKKFCDATGHSYPTYFSSKNFPPGTARNPVVMVSWTDADAYARWAGKRLPTETEWEAAAGGSAGRTWPWGDSWIPDAANTREAGEGNPAEVGSHLFDISEFGAFDMAGNVSEWTQDWYQQYPGNARKEKEYGGQFKVLRGGSAKASKDFARAQFRARLPVSFRSIDLGFRCAFSAGEEHR